MAYDEFIEQVLYVYPSGRCDEILSQIGIRKLTKEELWWKALHEVAEPMLHELHDPHRPKIENICRFIGQVQRFMRETARRAQ